MSEHKTERKLSERKTAESPAAPWRVPVAADDIAETGQHFELTADAAVRAAVAELAGLRELPRLEASFDVNQTGAGGLHIAGTVSATVGQNCVVTLEPLVNEVRERVDLVFVPRAAEGPEGGKGAPAEAKWDGPEALTGGGVDLGAIAAEFLLLGVDPYPRKPGAVFEALEDRTPDPGPFAALAKLAKN